MLRQQVLVSTYDINTISCILISSIFYITETQPMGTIWIWKESLCWRITGDQPIIYIFCYDVTANEISASTESPQTKPE